MEVGKEKERKITCLSSMMLKETANRQECEDTKEMIDWRGTSQEGIDRLWKDLCGTMEEEVLEEYRVEEAKKSAY